jgi:AcrR family transcriptional regulator
MDGFERRKEQKKEAIRRAALHLFQDFGFKKVSISEIAQRASVSQVTIYNHFGSKDELVRDVMKWYLDSLVDKYLAIMKEDGSFLDRLETIVFDKMEVARLFQGEIMQRMWRDDPELQGYIEQVYSERVTPALIAFFDEGREQGFISYKLSAETISFYIEIMRRGIFATPDAAERFSASPEMTREIIEIMTYGFNG